MKTIRRAKRSGRLIHTAKDEPMQGNRIATRRGIPTLSSRDRSKGIFGEPPALSGTTIFTIDEFHADQLGRADWLSRMHLHANEADLELKELQQQLELSKKSLSEVQAAYALLKRFQAEQESPHSRLMKALRLPKAQNILQILSTATAPTIGIEILVQGVQDLKVVSELAELGYLTLAERTVKLSPTGKDLLATLGHQ